ncbi:hypothetical protein DL96DRAFT_1683004 [Flagelloscypha sp. PMI_526]|nr:hypothetical protein DL96DRAFT_1683004 [Flagelloscypha sp. PMI_526]
MNSGMLLRRASQTFGLQTKQDIEDMNAEREAKLQWRLHLAQDIPDAIRTIHLVPYHGFVEEKRTILMRTVLSALRPLIGLTAVRDWIFFKTPQEHTESLFLSVLPSLIHVHELYIRKDIRYYLPYAGLERCRSIDAALGSWASRLTLLSLDVSNAWEVRHCFPPPVDGRESKCYSLPLLRTFKIHFYAAEPYSNPGVVQLLFDLIRDSPLLEEFEYCLYDASWSWNGLELKLPEKTLHPNLRSFTWSRVLPSSALKDYDVPTAVETCLSQYAPQLSRVHLDIAPRSRLSYLLQFDISPLTELRLNAALAVNPNQLVHHLSKLQYLRILELSGCFPLLNGDSYFRRMEVLEEFYVPVHSKAFNSQVLCDIAKKTPRLQKLVLSFGGKPLAHDPKLAPHGLRELHTATDSSGSLDGWRVQDFGVHIPGAKTSVIIPLVEAIARPMPSIRSFYGTGTLVVPAMASVDPAWFGKLK